ncbi:MAG: cytochrome c oxidase subunit 3 [Chitinophagaceae bacterium]|nr:cytochrome c oxidase subunit 3 [Chitinophagaceae bacterium]
MSTLTAQRQKIHPHKLLLWIAIASICMMFAGWTSAFLVRKAQGNWLLFSLPTAFWVSTAVILASSVTMHLSIKEFKKRNMGLYKKLISVTAILGVLFMLLQFWGFYEMHGQGVTLASNGEGISGSFIYVISGVHILHMLGGVIALVIVFFVVNFRKRTKVYSSNGLEILGTYWHFVDVLWIYLFLFFLFNQK